MDHDRDLIFKKPQGPGRCRIINRFHVAHFHKMIARSQGPQLILPPFQCLGGNEVRPRTLDAPRLFNMFQILGRSIALPNGPLSPLLEDLFLVFRREFKILPVRTHAGRNIPKKGFDDLPDLSLYFLAAQPGAQQTHSSVDVVAHPAGETIPSSGSKAATPPIGNPYPQ